MKPNCKVILVVSLTALSLCSAAIAADQWSETGNLSSTVRVTDEKGKEIAPVEYKVLRIAGGYRVEVAQSGGAGRFFKNTKGAKTEGSINRFVLPIFSGSNPPTAEQIAAAVSARASTERKPERYWDNPSVAEYSDVGLDHLKMAAALKANAAKVNDDIHRSNSDYFDAQQKIANDKKAMADAQFKKDVQVKAKEVVGDVVNTIQTAVIKTDAAIQRSRADAATAELNKLKAEKAKKDSDAKRAEFVEAATVTAPKVLSDLGNKMMNEAGAKMSADKAEAFRKGKVGLALEKANFDYNQGMSEFSDPNLKDNSGLACKGKYPLRAGQSYRALWIESIPEFGPLDSQKRQDIMKSVNWTKDISTIYKASTAALVSNNDPCLVALRHLADGEDDLEKAKAAVAGFEAKSGAFGKTIDLKNLGNNKLKCVQDKKGTQTPFFGSGTFANSGAQNKCPAETSVSFGNNATCELTTEAGSKIKFTTGPYICEKAPDAPADSKKSKDDLENEQVTACIQSSGSFKKMTVGDNLNRLGWEVKTDAAATGK